MFVSFVCIGIKCFRNKLREIRYGKQVQRSNVTGKITQISFTSVDVFASWSVIILSTDIEFQLKSKLENMKKVR